VAAGETAILPSDSLKLRYVVGKSLGEGGVRRGRAEGGGIGYLRFLAGLKNMGRDEKKLGKESDLATSRRLKTDGGGLTQAWACETGQTCMGTTPIP